MEGFGLKRERKIVDEDIPVVKPGVEEAFDGIQIRNTDGPIDSRNVRKKSRKVSSEVSNISKNEFLGDETIQEFTETISALPETPRVEGSTLDESSLKPNEQFLEEIRQNREKFFSDTMEEVNPVFENGRSSAEVVSEEDTDLSDEEIQENVQKSRRGTSKKVHPVVHTEVVTQPQEVIVGRPTETVERETNIEEIKEAGDIALHMLSESAGWDEKIVEPARSFLIEKGFLGLPTKEAEAVQYIQSLDRKAIDSIEDWPPKLLEILRECNVGIKAHEQFKNTYEVSLMSRTAALQDITLENRQLTPRQAIGFLKGILRIPEYEGQYSPEVLQAFDDRHLTTIESSPHYKPENPAKVQSAVETLIQHEIIRDPKWQFDKRFTDTLWLRERDLRMMEGFKELTLSQQKLVYENVIEYQTTHPESVAGKIWNKIRKNFGSTNQSENASEKLKSVVGCLVRNMAEHGPRVHETEKGVLIPDLIGLEYHRDHRKEQREASNALNRAAHALAQTPDSWRKIAFDPEAKVESNGIFAKLKSSVARIFSADTEKKNTLYTEREKAYDDAKNTFAEALRKSGMGEAGIIRALIELDGKVTTLQFAQTAPEALEAIRVGGDARVTEEITRSFNTKEALAYMGIGAVSNMALKQTFDWATGPAVASALGGIKAWRKSGKELLDRDRKARFGEVDTSKEALNVVQIVDIVTSEKGRTYDRGVVAKTRSIIDRIQELHGDTSEEALASRTKLLEQLKVRVDYVEEKRRLNRINFGKSNEVTNNIAKLYEVLAEAHVLFADRIDPAVSLSEMRFESIRSLEIEGGASPEAAAQSEVAKVRDVAQKKDARRTAYFTKLEQNIQKKRFWFKTKEGSKGALKAGAFSLLGAGLIELFEYDRQIAETTANGRLDELKERVRDVFTERNGVPALEVTNGTEAFVVESMEGNISAAEGLQTLEDIREQIGVETQTLPTSYEIKSGDTFITILKDQIPSFRALGTGPEQETAIANLLKSLTPQELKSIGVESGNVNRIFAGKTLNLEAIAKLVAQKK